MGHRVQNGKLIKLRGKSRVSWWKMRLFSITRHSGSEVLRRGLSVGTPVLLFCDFNLNANVRVMVAISNWNC
jgi:hypothetical protein